MKMETPKMDVVRFQEADVLAASTPVFQDKVTIANLGDSNYANNRVSGTAGTGFNFTFNEINSGSLAHLLNLDSQFKNGDYNDSLRNLIDKTNPEDADYYSHFIGTYEWSSTEGKYLHQ